LQPAQLDAAQEEQPDDMDLVDPSLPRETPLKQEKSCSTSLDSQSGHWIPFPDPEPKTSFSNSASHFRHLYSNIGIVLRIPFDILIVTQNS
jgi:hypothetical protein